MGKNLVKEILIGEATALPDKSSYEIVIADWRETNEFFNDMSKALKKLGVGMYEIPSEEGSDNFAFIISKGFLNKRQIDAIDKTLVPEEG
jgi:hypothetical protein